MRRPAQLGLRPGGRLQIMKSQTRRKSLTPRQLALAALLSFGEVRFFIEQDVVSHVKLAARGDGPAFFGRSRTIMDLFEEGLVDLPPGYLNGTRLKLTEAGRWAAMEIWQRHRALVEQAGLPAPKPLALTVEAVSHLAETLRAMTPLGVGTAAERRAFSAFASAHSADILAALDLLSHKLRCS